MGRIRQGEERRREKRDKEGEEEAKERHTSDVKEQLLEGQMAHFERSNRVKTCLTHVNPMLAEC